jgi:Na+-transporting NADH:ubiquinone oxidoreductase subunit C
MIVVITFLLMFVSSALKERQIANIELDKKRQILSSLRLDLRGQDVNALFDKHIVGGLVINSNAEILKESREAAFEINIAREFAKPLNERQLPIFIADVNGQRKYIFGLRGAGLWGPLWGYLALDNDRNTIFGVNFSHASETPGLGSQIAERPFQEQFVGKRILNDRRQFVSVAVMKVGQRADGRQQVDALTGGTITCKGVEKMLYNSLLQYDKFFQQASPATAEQVSPVVAEQHFVAEEQTKTEEGGEE